MPNRFPALAPQASQTKPALLPSLPWGEMAMMLILGAMLLV